MRKMKRLFVAAVGMMGVAAALLTVPQLAQADTVFPLVQPLKYKDSDGTGVLTLKTLTLDSQGSGGVKIQATLSQNGRTFTGSGFRLRIFTPPPNSADMQTVDLVVFTLRDGFGRAFVFRGQVREGGLFPHVEGGGRYEQGGTGVDIDNWQVSNL